MNLGNDFLDRQVIGSPSQHLPNPETWFGDPISAIAEDSSEFGL